MSLNLTCLDYEMALYNCGDIRKVIKSAKIHELEKEIDYGYFAVLW